eukprot:6550506-Karenia_brevis.AAC.1
MPAHPVPPYSGLTKNQRHRYAANKQRQIIAQLQAQLAQLRIATAAHASSNLNAAAATFVPATAGNASP